MGHAAKIILDSVGPNGARATTFELTIPRMVLAELNTHRALSKNAASSRAIPVKTLMDRIMNDPAMPVFWGRNQKGMQASEELAGEDQERARKLWLRLRDVAVAGALELGDPEGIDLHKQLANRVAEPWMFTTDIVTATEWGNVWGLRVDPAAQPEFERAMHMAYDAYDASEPRILKAGEWHLPYVSGAQYDEAELKKAGFSDEELCLISVGRCARVSFLTHDGKRDPKADIALARERLIPSGHMSPTEHPLQAMSKEEWTQYASKLARDWIYDRIPVGNVWGFRQYRKTIHNEHDFSRLKKVNR